MSSHLSRFLFGIALFCNGCGLILGGTAGVKQYYVLNVPEVTAVASQKRPYSIFLADIDCPSYICGKRIVYSREEGTRGFYQYAFWAEPLGSRLKVLFAQFLRLSGLFQDVSQENVPTGDFRIVSIRVADFYFDTTKEGSVAVGIFEYSLSGVSADGSVSRGSFERRVEVEGRDLEGIVRGFQKLLDQLSGDLITFLIDAK